jgi:hypothetical protein
MVATGTTAVAQRVKMANNSLGGIEETRGSLFIGGTLETGEICIRRISFVILEKILGKDGKEAKKHAAWQRPAW